MLGIEFHRGRAGFGETEALLDLAAKIENRTSPSG
jgi:hypothetical protein